MLKWADEALEKAIGKYERGARRAKEQGVIPYSGGWGDWSGAPFDGNSWWTNGFWPGIMWQLYNVSGDVLFREEALRAEALLARELSRFTLLNHDVGFMYMPSVGVHYLLEGDEIAFGQLCHAATILAGRFNPNGFICAWNQNRPGWAIIDCMMNLCLLYQMSELTHDPRFALIARRHANTTMEHFIRPDGSCEHIVIFDPLTGAVLGKPAGQGCFAGSSWSRGQAWAIYGFALSYMHTLDARYLGAARRVADYFLEHIRPDALVDCDFRQPKEIDLIDNIASACAACALLELGGIVAGETGKRYVSEAVRMLRALDDLCCDWSKERLGILRKCTASYHDDGAGRHVNIVYGDYFFIEALIKLRGNDIRIWMPRG